MVMISSPRGGMPLAANQKLMMKIGAGVCVFLFGYVLGGSNSYDGCDTISNSNLLAPIQDSKKSPAVARGRWDKYKNVYNYEAPAYQFQGADPKCGSAPDFEPFFQLDKHERSRLDEDKIIYTQLFRDRVASGNGASFNYIEMGAFDGKTESNSRFFDLCLGWNGLLVEGNPGNYEKARANRPRTHRLSFAPSCSAEYEAVNKTITFWRAPALNSGLENHAVTYKNAPGKPRPQVKVPCGPLGPVLQDIFGNSQTIHFFSLDVEGAEPLVLQTIDFENGPKIEVLMIEVENANCKKDCPSRDQTRAIMDKWGYQRVSGAIRASDVFVHPDLPQLATALEKYRDSARLYKQRTAVTEA